MKKHPSFRRRGSVVLALFLAAATGTGWAYEEEAYEGKDGKTRDESWQIEQRQRWFDQSREFSRVKNAATLRAGAAADLKKQRSQHEGLQRAAGEVWSALGPSSMTMGSWTMGRVAGRPNAVVPHPTDDNTLYFGSAAGGVWKTTNAGASWTPIFDQVGTLPIGSIFVEPASPNAVWVGTGDRHGGGCSGYFGQGVYLSSDAGSTWTAKNGSGATAMPLSIVNAVAVQPTNSNVVLAGGAGNCNSSGVLSGAGLFRSTDRGTTWTRTLNGNVEDILFVPGTATVYASAGGGGVYKSTDGGATWVSSSSGMTVSGSRLRLAMAPSDSRVLYALMGSNVYRSGDSGATWQLRSSSACEGQCSYNQAITVHPTQINTILIGTIRPARSTDGGATFSILTSSWGSAQQVHQDTHVVLYSRNTANRFWIGSDGGVWRTDNNGSSWVNMNSNLNVTQFYDIALDPNNPDIVFGGAQDNSSSSRSNSLVWNLTYVSGDGFMNAVDPTNTSIVFQSSYPTSSGYPNIVRSTQGGAANSFSSLPTTGLTAGGFPWVTPLAVASNRIFVASNRVFRGITSANPFQWTAISNTLGSTVSVLSPMQRGVMLPTFVGTTGGRVYSTPDAAVASVTWTDVTGNYPGGLISDIAADPQNGQRVFITRAGFNAARLYRSTTGGTNWTAVGAGLPNVPANAVSIDPLNPNRIFVGTDIGVYESADGGDNFIAFSAGLPLGLVVTDLEIDDVPHVLVAGTYSRGAWKVTLNGGSNTAPTANYSFTTSNLTATFTDSSTDPQNNITARSWNFGDGSTSTLTNPTRTYASAGTYSVQLTVTDAGGLSNSITRQVTVTSTSGCPGTAYSGSFSGANGQTQYQPSGSYYYSSVAGAHRACLTGPAGTDFDLYLDFWNGSAWVQVAASEGSSSTESINYNGAVGYYMYRVKNYSGTGSYSLTISKP
ncbi:PKD domain-containing protein [Tahibacter amnicola]|uniref:PKD domain-containing protein n=1 Tax=Tahibacter amnicola TaxID=2976241 RepID=A0ABY6BIZ4_9GAMM|nr:PKD domain-containing protein [Tahibacter amnicola]UXI69981.1 PKD domain-containing protein [Tahibacter amnicola]